MHLSTLGLQTARIVTLIFILLSLGCSNVPATPTEQPAPLLKVSITKSEALKFGERFRSALEKEGVEAKNLLDKEAYWGRCISNVQLARKVKDSAKRGYLSQLDRNPAGIFQDLWGGKIRVLRYSKNKEFPRLLVRGITAKENLVVYLELLIHKESNELHVVDVYNYSNGELLSTTTRRIVLPILAQLSKKPIQALVSGEVPGSENMHEFLKVVKRQQGADFVGAVEAYKELGKETRERREILLYAMYLVSKTDQVAYGDQLLRQFIELYPNDPSSLFNQVMLQSAEGDLDELLLAVDNFEKELGVKEPYLDLLRAGGYTRAGQFSEAEVLARKVIKTEPELEDAYWALVDIGVLSGNHQLTAEGLTSAEAAFPNGDYEGIDQFPDMQDFIQSSSGQKWKKARQEGAVSKSKARPPRLNP